MVAMCGGDAEMVQRRCWCRRRGFVSDGEVQSFKQVVSAGASVFGGLGGE
jgi:hypothetical protein